MKQTNVCYVLMFFLLVSCKTLTSNQPTEPAEIKGVKIYVSLPHILKDNQFFNWEDSLIVYLYRDYIIFEDEIRKQNIFITPQKDGTVKSTLISRETRPIYTITKKGVEYGYFSDSGKISKVLMDTVIRKKFLMNLSGLFKKTVETNGIFTGRYEEKNGDIVDKYTPKIKPDKSYSDTTYLFYTSNPGLINLNYTLSEKLDKVGNKKLYKIHSLYLPDPASADENYRFRRDAIYRIKKITVEQKGKIREMFEKFIPML